MEYSVTYDQALHSTNQSIPDGQYQAPPTFPLFHSYVTIWTWKTPPQFLLHADFT